MENAPEKDESPLNKGKSALSNYARYSALGFQMFFIIGAFTYAGYKIDENRGADSPLATAFFSLAGVFIALYIVLRTIRKIRN